MCTLTFEACSVSGLWRLFDGQRLTKTGSFSIVVRACALDYTLSLHDALPIFAAGVNLREAGDAPEPIAFGQISGGHIGLADLDTYTFTAASNDVISVAQIGRTNVCSNVT